MASANTFYLKHRTFIELAILLSINLLLKGIYLPEASIGGDECFSVYYSQLPVAKIIATLSRGNNPPLNEILLHFWIKLFGISEGSVRFPSLIFSCLAVIPMYLTGERFLKRGTGSVAALLFSFSSFSLFMAQEARVYNLELLLTCLSFFVFLNLYNKSRSYWLWLLLILLNTSLLYAHYLAVWVLMVQGIAVLVHRQMRERMMPGFLLHGAGVAILFSPFIPVLYNRFLDSGIHGTWVSTVSGISDFYTMLWTFSNQPVVTVTYIAILLVSLILFPWFRRGESILPAPGIFTVGTWVWLPLVVSFILSFYHGFFMDRYMFFTIPAYYLCVAAASVYLASFLPVKYSFAIPATVVILMASTFSIHSKGMKHSNGKGDLMPLVEKIKEYKNDSAAVLIYPDWFDKEIVYYFDRNMFTHYFEESDSGAVFKKALLKDQVYLLHSKNEIPGGLKRIIYVDNNSEFFFHGNGILDKLNSEYRLKQTFPLERGMVIYLFEQK